MSTLLDCDEGLVVKPEGSLEQKQMVAVKECFRVC